MTKIHLTPLTLTLCLCLAGCGGGGGGGTNNLAADTGPVAPAAQPGNLWSATTSTNRAGDIIILDDGSYYFLYAKVGDPTTLGGAIQGQVSGPNNSGSIASTNSIDYNWESGSGASAVLSSSLAAQTLALNGSVSYDATERNFSFTSTYRPASSQVTSLAELAGPYVSKDGLMNLTITSAGVMSGAFTSGCNFKGKVTPTTNYTTVLSVAITFQGGNCSQGTASLKGIAIYDTAQRELSAMAIDTPRTSAILFQARKPAS